MKLCTGRAGSVGVARAFEEHVEGILERGVVAAAELVMAGGILAAAGGEVGVGNEPGPEAALVGREGGVGDVPGEGARRTSGEVAPEDVLGGFALCAPQRPEAFFWLAAGIITSRGLMGPMCMFVFKYMCSMNFAFISLGLLLVHFLAPWTHDEEEEGDDDDGRSRSSSMSSSAMFLPCPLMLMAEPPPCPAVPSACCCACAP